MSTRLDIYREQGGRWLTLAELDGLGPAIAKLRETDHLVSAQGILLACVPGAAMDVTFEREVTKALLQELKKQGRIRYRKSHRKWELI